MLLQSNNTRQKYGSGMRCNVSDSKLLYIHNIICNWICEKPILMINVVFYYEYMAHRNFIPLILAVLMAALQSAVQLTDGTIIVDAHTQQSCYSDIIDVKQSKISILMESAKCQIFPDLVKKILFYIRKFHFSKKLSTYGGVKNVEVSWSIPGQKTRQHDIHSENLQRVKFMYRQSTPPFLSTRSIK